MGGDFSILISNDGGATKQTLASDLTNTDTWTEKTILLTDYTNDDVILYFKGTSNYNWTSGDSYIYLDNVLVDTTPNCVNPIDLVASEPTTSSVKLAWTDKNETPANSYTVAYGSVATFDLEDPTTYSTTTANTNPFTLTDLNAYTNYKFAVRANCGGNEYSEWSETARAQTKLTPSDCDPASYRQFVLGTGSSAANTIPGYMVASFSKGNSWTIYPASELIANDVYDGLVKGVAYQATTTASVESIKIYMANTDMTSFSNPSDTISRNDMTLVYSGPVDFAANEWTEIAFNNAFSYDGHSNIVILFCRESAIPNDISCYYTIADLTPTFCYSKSGTRLASHTLDVRPNTRFTMCVNEPSCFKVEEISADSIRSTSIDLSWKDTRNTGASYTVEYGLAGFTQGEGTVVSNINTLHTTIENLSPATNYDFYVTPNCGSSDNGESKMLSVSTIYGFPFSETFETSDLPADWTRLSGDTANPVSTTSGWVSSNIALDDYHFKINIYNTDKYWLVTPNIDLTDATSAELTFDMAVTAYNFTARPSGIGADSDDRFMVIVSTDGGQTWDKTNATTWGYGYWNNTDYDLTVVSNTGDYVKVPLDSYIGGTVMIAFYGASTTPGSDFDIHVDNVKVAPASNCLKPIDLIASEPSPSSINLAWTDQDETPSGHYTVAYGPAETFDLEDQTTYSTTTANTNPFTLTGLNAYTNYKFAVRANCGNNEYSEWSATIKALTTPDCDPAAYQQFVLGTESYLSFNIPGNMAADCPKADSWTIYPASELIANNAYEGLVKGVAYQAITTASVESIKIYMANTNKTSFSSSSDTISRNDMTLVYSGPVDFVANEWTEIAFDNAFSHDGHSSIALLFCRESAVTTYISFSYTSVSSSSVYYYPLSNGSHFASTASNRPNTRFTMCVEEPSCFPVDEISADNISSTSLNLSWKDTRNAGASYTVEYGLAGFTQGEGTVVSNINTLHTTIENLSPATNYDFYVTPNCGSSDNGISRMSSVSTIYAFPFSETFETSAILPTDWTRLSGAAFVATDPVSATSGWVPSNIALDGYHFKINIYYTDKYWLVTPNIDLKDATSAELTFDLAVTDYNSAAPAGAGEPDADDRFMVIVSTDGGQTWAETNATTWGTGDGCDYDLAAVSNTGDSIKVPLDSYLGGTVMIAFYGASTSPGSDFDIHVDNVKVAPIYNCPEPTNLLTSNITAVSADIAWTPADTATSWQYVCVAAGTTPDWSTATTVTTPSASLSGLSVSTNYDVYVRTYCSAEDQSGAVNVSFTTPCYYNIPFAENFNTSTVGIPDCWDNSEGTTTYDLSKWNPYQYGYEQGGLRFNSYANANGNTNLLATPVIHLSAPSQLTFMYKNPTDGDFSILISNNGGATRQTLTSGLTNTADWTADTILLTDYTNDDVIIYFKGTSNYASGDAFIYLDNVLVDAVPKCLNPLDLVASEPTASSMKLAWTDQDGMPVDSYTIAYGLAETFNRDSAATYTLVENVNNPYTLESLSASTSYTFMVKANCSEENSNWSETYTFKTSCPAVQNITYSDLASNSVTISWNRGQNGEETQWEVGVVGNNNLVWTVDDSTAFVYGLSPITDYEIYVSPVCDITPEIGETVLITTDTTNFIIGECPIVADGSKEYYRTPIFGSSCNDRQHSQSIYPAEMLTELQGKTIVSLKYFSSTTNSNPVNGSWNGVFTIKMQITNEDSFSDTLISNDEGTTVYTGDLQITNREMEITLDRPFVYTSGNLLIDIDLPEPANFLPCLFYGIETENTSSICLTYNYNWNYMYYSKFLSKVQFCCVSDSCLNVTRLAVSDITAHEAHASWYPGGSETAWNLVYSTSELSEEELNSAPAEHLTAPYFDFTDLDFATNYYVYVQADCGSGNVSSWESTSFTTLCGTFVVTAENPFIEDFEDGVFPPSCWSDIKDSTYSWTNNIHSQHPSPSAFSGFSGDIYLITLPISLPEDMPAILSFESFNSYPSDYGRNNVLISTTGTDISDFTNVWSPNTIEARGIDTISLTDYNGQTIYIAFRHEGLRSNGWYVDNVKVETIDIPCQVPTSLASNKITYKSATLSWTSNNSLLAHQYVVAYGPSNNFNLNNNATYTTDTVATNELALTGLTANTEYTFAVKALCFIEDESDWSNSTTFTTCCEPLAVTVEHPFVEDFENSYVFPPACWSQISKDNDHYWSKANSSTSPGCHGKYHAYSGFNGDIYLITPALVLPERGKARLSIFTRYEGSNHDNNSVLISTTGTEADDFTSIYVHPSELNWYNMTETVNLDDYAGDTIYIAFRHNKDVDDIDYYNTWHLDDITVEIIPEPCEIPSSLAAEDVTLNSATLSWTDNNTTSAPRYAVAYGPSANFNLNNNATYTTDTVTTNELALTGLTANTEYTFAVKALCAEGDESDWSEQATFQTLVDPCAMLTLVASADETEVCEGSAMTLRATSNSSDVTYQWHSNATPTNTYDGDTWYFEQVTQANAGTYIVAINDSVTGCEMTDTVIVTVKPLPVVETITQSITQGQSVDLDTCLSNVDAGTTISWYDGEILLSSSIVTPNASTTYYAVGELNGCESEPVALIINMDNIYVVTLNQPEAGGHIESDTAFATAGETITLSATPDNGYHFASWTVTNDNDTISVNEDNEFIMPANNVTVSATFEPNVYNITYVLFGGTINSDNVETYTYGVGATLPTDVTKTGYTFAGWYDNPDLTGTAITAIGATDSHDTTFYAKWDTTKSYVLTINYQYADGTIASTAYTDTLDNNTDYAVPSPTIATYMPDMDTVKGTMGTENVTLSVTYSQVVMDTVVSLIVCNNNATGDIDFHSSVSESMTYNWINDETSIGLDAEGSDTIKSFTAINNTEEPVSATITVTPTCTQNGIQYVGVPRTFTITVNPTYVTEFTQSACDSFVWEGITYNTEGLNDYTRTLTDAYGCDSIVTMHLTIFKTPTSMKFDITDNTTCTGTPTGAINVTSPTGDFEYSIDGTTFQTATLFEQLNNDTYTVYVRPTGSTCVYQQTATVENTNTYPTAVLNVNNDLVCVDGSIDLSSEGSDTGDDITYSWSGPNEYSSSEANPSIPVTSGSQTGTYTLTVTNTSTNCSSSTDTVITVNDPDNADYDFSITCAPEAFAYIDNSGSATITLVNPTVNHYLENTIANYVSLSVTLTNDAPESYTTPGSYNITWTATDNCGNTATCIQPVTIAYTECPDVQDFEGNTYRSVRIGHTCWMADNLRSSYYYDGRPISNVMSYSCNLYPDANANAATFGYLYDWYAAMDTATGMTPNENGNLRGICPDGWVLPTAEQFAALADDNSPFTMDDFRVNGMWLDGGGNNSTGMSLLPSGYYNGYYDRYENLYGEAYFWSYNDAAPSEPKTFWADCHCYMFKIVDNHARYGCSVRCVKE